MQRLKWLVLRQFGVLPGSKRAGELSWRDYIYCGRQMLLDSAGPQKEESAFNAGFDRRRFESLGARDI